MSMVLKRLGATVDTAVDGLDALRRLEQSVPDVLVSDLDMPNMGGLALLRRVGELYPTVVPVVLTASMEREDAIAALKEGVFDFVEKAGTDTSGVELAVRRAADRSRMLRERRELLEELRNKNEQLETGMSELQRAYAGLREQDAQLQHDLARAQQIQRRMLPAEFPSVGDYDFCAYYRPCDWLGGDFFGRIPLSGERVAFYLADVSGHGVAASMVTVELREIIRARRRYDDADALFGDPVATLGFLNRALWEEFGGGTIHVTMFYGVLDAENHRLVYASAGHPDPFMVAGETYVTLPCVSAAGLALLPNTTFNTGSVGVERGALLLIYSDGLLEAPGTDGVCLTKKALGSCFAHGNDARGLADRVVARFADHLGARALPDDVSFLAIHRGMQDAQPTSEPTVTFAEAGTAVMPLATTDAGPPLTRAEASDTLAIRLSGRATWQLGKVFQDQISAGIESQTSRIVVDLSYCDSLDSTMLGLLCRLPEPVEIAGLHGQAEAQARELGIRDMLRCGRLPGDEFVFTPVGTSTGLAREQAEMILHAHEVLSNVNDANRERFAGVVGALQAERQETQGGK